MRHGSSGFKQAHPQQQQQQQQEPTGLDFLQSPRLYNIQPVQHQSRRGFPGHGMLRMQEQPADTQAADAAACYPRLHSQQQQQQQQDMHQQQQQQLQQHHEDRSHHHHEQPPKHSADNVWLTTADQGTTSRSGVAAAAAVEQAHLNSDPLLPRATLFRPQAASGAGHGFHTPDHAARRRQAAPLKHFSATPEAEQKSQHLHHQQQRLQQRLFAGSAGSAAAAATGSGGDGSSSGGSSCRTSSDDGDDGDDDASSVTLSDSDHSGHGLLGRAGLGLGCESTGQQPHVTHHARQQQWDRGAAPANSTGTRWEGAGEQHAAAASRPAAMPRQAATSSTAAAAATAGEEALGPRAAAPTGVEMKRPLRAAGAASAEGAGWTIPAWQKQQRQHQEQRQQRDVQRRSGHDYQEQQRQGQPTSPSPLSRQHNHSQQQQNGPQGCPEPFKQQHSRSSFSPHSHAGAAAAGQLGNDADAEGSSGDERAAASSPTEPAATAEEVLAAASRAWAWVGSKASVPLSRHFSEAAGDGTAAAAAAVKEDGQLDFHASRVASMPDMRATRASATAPASTCGVSRTAKSSSVDDGLHGAMASSSNLPSHSHRPSNAWGHSDAVRSAAANADAGGGGVGASSSSAAPVASEGVGSGDISEPQVEDTQQDLTQRMQHIRQQLSNICRYAC